MSGKHKKKFPENFWKIREYYIPCEKKQYMGITIDTTYTTHYGCYTDEDRNMYSFSVEITEKDGTQELVEIIWDDERPENIDEIEEELRNMF